MFNKKPKNIDIGEKEMRVIVYSAYMALITLYKDFYNISTKEAIAKITEIASDYKFTSSVSHETSNLSEEVASGMARSHRGDDLMKELRKRLNDLK